MIRLQCTAVFRTFSNLLRTASRETRTQRQRHLTTQSLSRSEHLPRTRLLQFQSSPVPQSSLSRIHNARRAFSTTPIRQHGDLTPPKPGEERKVTFIDKEGHEHTFEVSDGDNLLDVAQANDLEMEGACGGSCACSTCHVIVAGDEMYDKMVGHKFCMGDWW